MSGARTTELDQCERDIAHYRALIAASQQGSQRHAAMLEAELEHRERITTIIRQAGGKQ